MSLNMQIWIAVLSCLLVGGVSCFSIILLLHKVARQGRGAATLMGAIVFAVLLATGGYLATMAQPEPGAAFVMMLAAFLALLFGLVAGPLAFVAMTREADS